MLVVGFGDHSALRDADIANVRIIRRSPHDIGAFQAFVPGLDVHVAIIQSRNGVRDFHVVAHPFVFIHSEQRALLGFHPLVLAGDDTEPIHNEYIGAEVGNAVCNVEIHARDDAHYRDERGHCQDDSQQRQKTAKLMRAE